MSQVETIATGERECQPKPINVGKVAWKSLNWQKIEKVVFKLQKRIYRASQSGNVVLVRRLQKLLSKSYYAKCLAVRKVTQDNAGKKTAGIDGLKSLNYSQRIELINCLEFTSKASPLRRVFIPKPGTNEKRGLGIPTIRDLQKPSIPFPYWFWTACPLKGRQSKANVSIRLSECCS